MRPIPKSDSCNTLIDVTESDQYKLDDNFQFKSIEDDIIQTNILLPSDNYSCDGFDDNFLYLPASTLPSRNSPCAHPMGVDEYLRNVPGIYESNDELLNQPHRLLTDDITEGATHNVERVNKMRVLNVCQGEVAHATSSQCDIIVSDHATTCHILALRSTSCNFAEVGEPMVSMSHIDQVGYEECVRDMLEQHKAFHGDGEVIDMDVHLMGGFNDTDGCSLEISAHLIDLLIRLADEEKDRVTMTLRTCALSSMNDDGFQCPIGRGLALNVRSGERYLASVGEDVAGPAMILRNARLWSSCRDGKKKLSVVHTVEKNLTVASRLVVQPFEFRAIRGTEILMQLPDDILLQHTSTSPEVEKEDFCDTIRRTLWFLKETNCQDVFGNICNKPVIFERVGVNGWKQL